MKTIYDAFKQQVSTQPNALAVMDETIELTIAELDTMATEIASGFPVEHPAQVGIVMQHGVRQIISQRKISQMKKSHPGWGWLFLLFWSSVYLTINLRPFLMIRPR